MEELVNVRGIIIKHSPVGDYDLVATIFTAERGKITAFARNARKPGNKLSGNVEPFSFGTFKLYEGRNSYTIIETSIDNYFEGFRQDFESACYGSFFLEIVNFYTRENNEDKELLNLLYVSLIALLNNSIPNRLVRSVFQLRALKSQGEYPGIPGEEALLDSTKYAMDYIVRSPLEKLYTFNVTKEVLSELEQISNRYIDMSIDRPLKSLEMLNIL